MRTLLFVSLLFTGCKGDPFKYLTGPEAFLWKSDTEFEIRGNPKMKGRLSHYDTELTFSVEGFPPELTIELGDRRITTRDDGRAYLKLDIMPQLAALPIANLRAARINHGLSVILTHPEHPQLIVPLPPLDVNPYSLASLLKKAADGPVRFGNEPPRPPGVPRSIMDLDDSPPKTYGAAGTLGELDAVAIAVRLPEVKGERQCGGYKDNNKKPMAPITVLLKDTEVTVYDRRAGGVIERRRFAPKDECPMFIMRRAGENSMDSYTPRDAISAWLRDYVAGGARPETVELK
jgi:hypothetical protein